jgi:hypothetical protein
MKISYLCPALLAVALVCMGLTPPTVPTTPPPPHPVLNSTEISERIAALLTSLIHDAQKKPAANAIDSYATEYQWVRNPADINVLLNAKSGYNGQIGGHKVVLGGDNTNNLIVVMITDGFDPAHVVSQLRTAFALGEGDTQQQGGQRIDSYSLREDTNSKPIGVIFLTYGTSDNIRGTGSAAFLSMDKVRAESAPAPRD